MNLMTSNWPIEARGYKMPVIDPQQIFDTRSLGFRITYKCNSKCEHCYCYTDKESANADELHIQELKELIPQAKALGMSGVGLSGGEPFLRRKTIEAVVEQAKNYGLNVNIATNGFWAKTAEEATEVMEKLKSLGFKPPLDSIAISAGQYHMPYINRVCTMNVIKAYKKVFNTCLPRLDFEYVIGNEKILVDYKTYLAENGVSEQDYKLVERTVFQTTGLAKITNNNIIQKRPVSVFKGLCPWTKDLIVSPNGDVYPCCGFNRYIDGIVIGNIHHQTLEEIKNAAQVNPVVIMLKRHSFAYLHSLLAEGFDLPKQADGLCDICEIIFSKMEHVNYLTSRYSHLYT